VFFAQNEAMSKRLLILTPNPAHPSHHGRWPEVLKSLTEALSDLRLEIDSKPWSEPLTAPYDLVVPLVAWGYHNAPQAFKEALAAIKAKGFVMQNPVEIVSWNIDKHYLKDLSEAGVRIVPTVFVDRVTREALIQSRADLATDTLVAKPVISAGAKQTLRIGPDFSALDNIGAHETKLSLPTGRAMLQPFMPMIKSEGEWSLLFFGGNLSHAVLKTPKEGDFRSQPDFEAHLQLLTPPLEAVELAYRALEYIGQTLLYARVDMVRDEKGQFCLMELELIEPDLYLGFDPKAPFRLAHAFEQSLGLGCSGHRH
jgi:hypothetical protein